MGRAPVRATAIREAVEEATPNKPKKTRLRKQAAQRSLLDIEASIVNMINEQYETDLQWVTDSVLGQAAPQNRMAFEINAWEPVTPDMFGGVFDGMFTRKGHTGEIIYDGLVLMHRPMELTKEAQAEDRAARDGAMEAQRNMVMNGVIPGLNTNGGFESMHPTAAGKQTFRREVKPPMDIPTE
jgi:hypothetical protein